MDFNTYSVIQKPPWYALTHSSRVMHICVGDLTIIGSDNGLSPGWHQDLNQYWNIVNWTLMNKLQRNFYQNYDIFIQEQAFESVICEMAAILSRPQCVYIMFNEGTNLTHYFISIEIQETSTPRDKYFPLFHLYWVASITLKQLTHCGWGMDIYISKLGHHWFR